MNVLIFGEYSDTVGSAFRDRGHNVKSCDLLPNENPEADHYQGDGRWLLREPYDLVIAHPPCTYLTKARGTPGNDDDILLAIELFIDCQNANAPKVAVENPTMYKFIRKIVGEPDFAVQPYYFGDWWQKRTWFWTKGLAPLMAAGMCSERQRPWHSWDSTGPARNSKSRSRFHPGMAAAMAQQWG